MNTIKLKDIKFGYLSVCVCAVSRMQKVIVKPKRMKCPLKNLMKKVYW